MFSDTCHSLSFVFLENPLQGTSSLGKCFPTLCTSLEIKLEDDSNTHKGWQRDALQTQAFGIIISTQTRSTVDPPACWKCPVWCPRGRGPWRGQILAEHQVAAVFGRAIWPPLMVIAGLFLQPSDVSPEVRVQVVLLKWCFLYVCSPWRVRWCRRKCFEWLFPQERLFLITQICKIHGPFPPFYKRGDPLDRGWETWSQTCRTGSSKSCLPYSLCPKELRSATQREPAPQLSGLTALAGVSITCWPAQKSHNLYVNHLNSLPGI